MEEDVNDRLLKTQFDNIIPSLRAAAPNFVLDYARAREIVDTGSTPEEPEWQAGACVAFALPHEKAEARPIALF